MEPAFVTFEDATDADLLEAAPDVLLAIADVATLLGIRQRDRNLGSLGGELAALSETLSKLDSPSLEEKFERRIRKLLRELARACTWDLTRPREDFASLFNLVSTSQPRRRSQFKTEAALLAYGAEGRLPKLLALVRGFASRHSEAGTTQPVADARRSALMNKAKTTTLNEYPKHVGKQLYRTLCQYSTCQCAEDESLHVAASAQRKQHLSRLRLRPCRDVKGCFICFDMVFSSRPVFPSFLQDVEWQHMQFQVSSERSGKKRARFSSSEPSLDLVEQQSLAINDVQLCEHIKSASGSQICLRIYQDRVQLLLDCLPLETHVLASPSLTLSAALQMGHLSNKMKVILAYIVARSVWEYYDSDWMSRPWSADDIHFLQEPPGSIDGQPVVSVNRPYLAVQWRENQTDMDDASTAVGMVHRYPRVLSLGLMLIEIGTGKLASDLLPNYQKNVNSAWLSAKEFLFQPTPWEDFDYRSYWDATRSCVNNQFFLRGNPAAGGDSLAAVESRRQMIFDDVVTPLEDLLSGTGWMHDIWTVKPIKISSTSSVSAIVTSLEKRDDTLDNYADQMHRKANGTVQGGHALPEASSENLSTSTPATQRRPHDRLGFEIAIICALPAEADAVISLFDVHWDKDDRRYGKAARDPNAYTTGGIGQHNVVVVHMPSMGKVSAANVAQGLRSSFENIQLALVVGICGGVPYRRRNKQEIFLGDVVISQSLIQYDFGRQYPGSFEAKDSLQGGSGKPSAEIRSILAKLETSHHRHELEITTAKFVRDSQHKLRGSVYPGPQKDKLFESTSLHRHRSDGECHICLSEDATHICAHALESSCEDLGCEASGVLRRARIKNGIVPPAQSAWQCYYPPSIHIGNMGSGDTVMKSGTHRDEVAQKYDIIGFEMEGAGIWDFFPSLVIKAVCDYADSHKNKEWQSYAAVTAAAATKAFLKEWRPEVAS
ncbi:hypothetical protein PV04_10710 [Phialophora macrospora]|uniref:Uncharacterized protein n=1 Tax=Phialophora macrospora TaxID=1851006 RepID=A0A0D2DJM9_9EURO|nr:hypothetical protein PV04_10710 [Phialophora macrospora]